MKADPLNYKGKMKVAWGMQMLGAMNFITAHVKVDGSFRGEGRGDAYNV